MLEQLQTVDAVYKDARPMDTVERIKGILDEYGIKTTVTWSESEVPNCYSLRVNIEGTKVGTNGKGVTKEFALASGYGEFMERLQQGNIWRNKMSFDKGVSAGDAQSTDVPAQELLSRNLKWYEAYAKILFDTTGISMTPGQILEQHIQPDGTVNCAPYYCVNTGRIEYLPLAMVKSVYGSNGGAAGNTMEEAIVQAISEIVERNHEQKIIHGHIPVPTIPEEVLKKCPIAYQVIEFLRDKGYRIVVKDCSLGTKFPVVCVCIIDTATGKYHTHFGAHPNFEVALQRTLTEAFQGRNINTIAQFDGFCYDLEDVLAFRRMITELVVGTSEKTPLFFIREPEEEYRPAEGFAGVRNRDCLKECMEYFRGLGLDVLIRDCSCLGFPTCQVIIPGYSEILLHRISVKYNNYRYQQQSTRALKNPTAVSQADLVALLMHVIESKKNRLHGVETFQNEAGIPARLSNDQSDYLMNAAMAYTHYALGNYVDVVDHVNKMLRTDSCGEKGYLICLKRYLSMVKHKYDAADIRKTLEYFHDGETVRKFYRCLESKGNPLHEYVLRCDGSCTEECPIREACRKRYTDGISALIVEKSAKMDQSALAAVFEGM